MRIVDRIIVQIVNDIPSRCLAKSINNLAPNLAIFAIVI